MISNEIKPFSETFGTLDEKFFGIADLGLIFSILRSKLYSNPILAVIRELSCNSRDAMREANRPNEPITIHLPNRLEPFFAVEDTGVGISPDRMENVFIKYAASTKRGDNIQNGFFGIGAKSFFGVSDSASITTIYNGMKRCYACYIDETKIGKLSLLSEIITDLPNGTTISVPVKPADFHLYKQYTQQACDHWNLHPTITGGDITWSVFIPALQGSNWSILSSNDRYSTGNAQLIIDGIQYPLDLTTLKKYADPKLIEATCGTLYLVWGIGELSLSANREQIFLDKPTQEKLAQRLTDITTEVKTLIQTKIDSYPDLFQANIYYRKELTAAFNSLSFLGKLTWKGCELSDYSSINVKCPVYAFRKGKYSYRRNHDPEKITRTITTDLEFTEHSAIYINDLPLLSPTPRHVKKAFESNPHLKSVQVINTNDTITQASLNKSINLDQMAPKLLSSITKASGRKYTPSTNRLLVFKADIIGRFCQVSYDSIDEDTNDKVLCLLARKEYPTNNRVVVLSNKQTLEACIIKALSDKFPTHSFYGVDNTTEPKRIKEDLLDLMPLEKFLDRKLFNKAINYTEIRWAAEQTREVDDRLLQHLDKLEKLVIDKSSPFLTRLHLHDKLVRLNKEENGLLGLYQAIKGEISRAALTQFDKDHPELNLGAVNKEYVKRYPLLGIVSSYYLESALAPIAQYVNLIDGIQETTK